MNRSTLVKGLRDRDEQTWRRFLVEYGRIIQGVLRRFALPEAEREDLFQDVCMAICSSIHSLRDADRLSSWTYGIAYRQGLLAIRKRKRHPLHEGLELREDRPIPDPGTPVDEELDRLRRAAGLIDAVENLGGRCRILLKLLFLEDPPATYEEIARRENIPVGSIGSTRNRCLEKLRALFEGVSSER